MSFFYDVNILALSSRPIPVQVWTVSPSTALITVFLLNLTRSDIQNKAADPISWNRSCVKICAGKNVFLAGDQWKCGFTFKISPWRVWHRGQLQDLDSSKTKIFCRFAWTVGQKKHNGRGDWVKMKRKKGTDERKELWVVSAPLRPRGGRG